jgi:soluble lytic murein transglycosylase-like protein
MEMFLGLVLCLSGSVGVSPYLTAAIISVESAWRPHVIGSVGEVGLMQLRPKYFGDAEILLDPYRNVKLGVRHLAKLKHQCRDISERVGWEHAYILCFNVGPKGARRLRHPDQFDYLRKVKAAYEQHKARRLFDNQSCN